MAKVLKFSEEARGKIKVALTHWPTRSGDPRPRGRNVIIEKSFGSPLVTRTASRWPRKSSWRTSSKTWAPRW